MVMNNFTISSVNQIRKRTAIVNILVIIALPFFAYWGYNDSNWVLEFTCLAVFPFVVWNGYKYFFKKEYRQHLNEYHDRQRELPKEKRYMTRSYKFFIMELKIFGIAIFLYAIFALWVFFNLN
jgi:hypothetical protein